MTWVEECLERNHTLCEGENLGEQELIRIYDRMKMGGMIKDYRFTYLGQTRMDDAITIHELLHVRRNNDVVDVYTVDITFKDGDITRVRMEKLFSI